MPLDVERIIEINDAVYSFSEIVDHIDLTKILAKKDSRMGRPGTHRDGSLCSSVLYTKRAEPFGSALWWSQQDSNL